MIVMTALQAVMTISVHVLSLSEENRMSLRRVGTAGSVMFLVVFCAGVGNAESDDAEYPSNVAKLVDAAWKKPVQSLDATVYYELIMPPNSREKIEGAVRRIYDATDEPNDRPGDEEREAAIAQEVDRMEVREGLPIVNRRRVQIRDGFVRQDRAASTEKGALSADSPWTSTFVNVPKSSGYDYTNFDYQHTTRIATIYNDRQSWRCPPYEYFPIMPSSAGSRLRVFLGERSELENGRGILIPSSRKLDALKQHSHGDLELSFRAVTLEGHPACEVTVFIRKVSEKPVMRLVCDATDFSRVYEYQAFNVPLETPTEERYCSHYDSNGYPREVKRLTYTREGAVSRNERFLFERVDVSADIPDEVFLWDPPRNYAIADHRFDKPIAISPNKRLPTVTVPFEDKTASLSVTKPRLPDSVEKAEQEMTSPVEVEEVSVNAKRGSTRTYMIIVAIVVLVILALSFRRYHSPKH
jgi:hypothetical protein